MNIPSADSDAILKECPESIMMAKQAVIWSLNKNNRGIITEVYVTCTTRHELSFYGYGKSQDS